MPDWIYYLHQNKVINTGIDTVDTSNTGTDVKNLHKWDASSKSDQSSSNSTLRDMCILRVCSDATGPCVPTHACNLVRCNDTSMTSVSSQNLYRSQVFTGAILLVLHFQLGHQLGQYVGVQLELLFKPLNVGTCFALTKLVSFVDVGCNHHLVTQLRLGPSPETHL